MDVSVEALVQAYQERGLVRGGSDEGIKGGKLCASGLGPDIWKTCGSLINTRSMFTSFEYRVGVAFRPLYVPVG